VLSTIFIAALLSLGGWQLHSTQKTEVTIATLRLEIVEARATALEARLGLQSHERLEGHAGISQRITDLTVRVNRIEDRLNR
jgi:cytochrome oxidase assembly protein ShyY1